MSKHVKKLRGGKAKPLTTEPLPVAVEIRFSAGKSFGIHPSRNGSELILFLSSGGGAMYRLTEAHEIGTALCRIADELTFAARGKK